MEMLLTLPDWFFWFYDFIEGLIPIMLIGSEG